MNRDNPGEVVVRCYMDGIDWQEHLGHDGAGTKLYPSERVLLREVKHLETWRKNSGNRYNGSEVAHFDGN